MAQQDNTDRILNSFDRISKVFASMESFGGEAGISKPELLALEAIFRHGALAMSEIARNLGVGMSTATSIADRLIEKKLAIRERSEGDRRVVRVTLTKKGEKINSAYQKQKKEGFSRMVSLLTQKEQECFALALEKIADEIQKERQL